MEMDDPDLPAFARAWAYAGADAVSAWLERVENHEVINPVDDLARTLLVIVEEQAKIIAELTLRVDAISNG